MRFSRGTQVTVRSLVGGRRDRTGTVERSRRIRESQPPRYEYLIWMWGEDEAMWFDEAVVEPYGQMTIEGS